MMPLKPLFKNKLLLQKHYHVNESCMDEWPFWLLEENIKIVNEMAEEEEKKRRSEEDSKPKNTPNFNPSSYMKDLGNVANKFKN